MASRQNRLFVLLGPGRLMSRFFRRGSRAFRERNLSVSYQFITNPIRKARSHGEHVRFTLIDFDFGGGCLGDGSSRFDRSALT